MSGAAVAVKPFAKLFETERGQILILRQPADETGDPEVRFFFDPNHAALAVCSFALGFPDNDAGHDGADKVFVETDQEGAERAVFAQMDAIVRMFAGAAA